MDRLELQKSIYPIRRQIESGKTILPRKKENLSRLRVLVSRCAKTIFMPYRAVALYIYLADRMNENNECRHVIPTIDNSRKNAEVSLYGIQRNSCGIHSGEFSSHRRVLLLPRDKYARNSKIKSITL